MPRPPAAADGLPVRQTYRRLLAHYGHQGWWPTTAPRGVRSRYHVGEPGWRPSPREQWEIAVGAVLTQNTTWRNAARALTALARARRLSLRRLADCPRDELAALIRPALYYNQKARNLQELAGYVVDRYGGRVARLLSQPPAALRAELLQRRGVGPETADCILLYAAGYPFFVVDAFTRRICSRLGWVSADVSYAAMQACFTRHLPCDPETFDEYHALLVRHAVERCRATPICQDCCLRARCAHAPQATPTANSPTGDRP